MPTIQVGQTLQVRLQEESREYYTSRLVELNRDEYFIDMPLHKSLHTPLIVRSDELFWVEFQAKDGAFCRFPTTLVAVTRIPSPVWRIPRPDNRSIIRDQRREFVRVDADFPVRLEYLSDTGHKFQDVYSKDISGGGIAIWLPRNVSLQASMYVTAKFTLTNDGFPVDVRCMVVRVAERNEQGKALASMQFLSIKETVRQKIIQYTFWRQRLLLK